jgi:hypothetical protein
VAHLCVVELHVQVANTYANGMNTSVLSRKLVTDSKFEVMFGKK